MSKTSAYKKIEEINLKIEQLRQEQEKHQHEIAQELVTVIDKNAGFNLDFNVVIGILIEGITRARTDSRQANAWEDMGLKFRKVRSPSTPKGANKSQKAA